jgi:IS1 family transposase
MNQLKTDKRLLILRALTEGNSLRGIARLLDCSFNTVMKLFLEAGEAAEELHDQMVRGLTTQRVQCDEIWSFIQCKRRKTTPEKRKQGHGDIWTWFALCADSRLIISYVVGARDTGGALDLLYDCRERIATERIQVTTDQLNLYLTPMHSAFMGEVDFAQLQKIYGSEVNPPNAAHKYSPAKYMGQRRAVISGNPDPAHVSTSYVERQNLTLRMSNRRFTRLTNAHSKKAFNHARSVSLYTWHYNFCRIQQGLRVTPAMEAGIADRVWELDDLLAFMASREAKSK